MGSGQQTCRQVTAYVRADVLDLGKLWVEIVVSVLICSGMCLYQLLVEALKKQSLC